MPECHVRYSVRLTPRASDAFPMSAIAVFVEDRAADEDGKPGRLKWRRLERFVGPAGPSLLKMVDREQSITMSIEGLAGPLEWD
jgi:hypothetical protein